MIQSKKRPLTTKENSGPILKQAKLSFTSTNQLKIDTAPQKETLKTDNLNDFHKRAVAPLQNTTWMSKLKPELNKPYMQTLFKKLEDEKKVIFPPVNLIFNAFVLTPFEKVRVVILGQDPYHNNGQAHGLSFSVPPGIAQPPSLKNIFRELSKEYPDFKTPQHGSLVKWAEQGVFMLNATLTVEAHNANSHAHLGWQTFTDSVIKTISKESTGVVFLLWGNFAHKKVPLVDQKRHAVIKTAHPSPLSYSRFADCKCFTQVNDALRRMDRDPIDWANI